MKRKKRGVIRLNAAVCTPYDAETEKKNNVIGARLAEARRQSGMSLAAFSEFLKDYGVAVQDAALSKWETGMNVPNAYQFMALCSALGIQDGLAYFSSSYQPQLNNVGMQKVADYKADLIATGKYKPELQVLTSDQYIEKPVSTLLVAAGTGNFLDDDNFELISFPASSVPANADFGVRVSGDSMEPVYHDGQIVWVEQCDELRNGEVGIFIYDNAGYIKVYGEQAPSEDDEDAFTDSYGRVRPQPVLISYNQKYAPRPVLPQCTFQIVGRVL